MWFTLTLRDRDGHVTRARYNPHTSQSEGLSIGPAAEARMWADVPKTSKDAPLGKSRAIRRLKIQMGLACNYGCSYCSQATQIVEATVSTLGDVETFLTGLDSWLDGAPDDIELWGGEPFVYWAKIKRLIPALGERYPAARFSIITNGSLFDREKLDFIAAYDITITISHDGPGQHLRGPDPLAHPERRRWIEALLAERPHATGFNAVLTAAHHDLEALRGWFDDQLGTDVPVSLEGVVNTYDAATALGTGRFGPSELSSLTASLFNALARDPDAFGLGGRLDEFIASLQQNRPVTALFQKCGMDRAQDIAVDLKGNVMTCQNTGAKGAHRIGHVSAFDDIRLDTSTHFAHRSECMSCPVVQLCKGSCMFLDGALFEQNCANEFAFNFGILRAALWHLTGCLLVGVEAETASAVTGTATGNPQASPHTPRRAASLERIKADRLETPYPDVE